MEKVQIKKYKIVVAAVFIAVFFSFLIFNFGAFQAYMVNSCEGVNARTSGFLEADEQYRQYFRPAEKDLSFIEVRFATYTGSEAKGSLFFSVLDTNGQVLSDATVEIKDLKDGEFYRFPVDLTLDPESTYSFVIQTVGNQYEKSPAAWVSIVSGTEEFRLSVPGSPASSLYQTHAQYGYLHTDYRAVALCIALILATAFVIVMPFQIKDKYKNLFGRLAFVLSPIVMFFVVEALNDNSAFKKITPAYILNYLAYVLIYLFLFAVTNRLRISMITANFVLYLLAVINYFKLLFRGEPLQPWDLFAAGTAMNVADNYTFYLSSILTITFLMFLLLNISLLHIDFSMKKIRTRALVGTLSVALSALMVVSLFGTDRYAIAAFSLMQKLGIVNNVWNQPSNYAKNGLVLAMTMNAQYMNVDVPEGYSEDAVQEIKDRIEGAAGQADITPASSYITDISEETSDATSVAGDAMELPEETTISTENIAPVESPSPDATGATNSLNQPIEPVKPNVIAIMCESFADLKTVGDFETNIEITPFIDSLTRDTIKGTTYVSTYGGGTANSEFEFLTGNSMVFLPNGSVPYQQYVKDQTGSLAWTLKNQGYSAIAVHPFTGSGWNRPSVYTAFGFDDFLSSEDFQDPIMMRSYISDASSYDKLIDLYEAKPEGQPIFLFNITMQNHGGYVPKDDNFAADVEITDLEQECPEAEEYLSLVRQSDAALKDLVTYFSEVDEPTVLVFFGDHLPKLKNSFYEELLGKDLESLSAEEMVKLYRTPFLIWANYDIPEKEIEAMSLNYLSTLVLQMTGLPLPDYNIYLSELFTSFPVITPMTIVSSDGTIYNGISELTDDRGIREYSILAYNNLFDKTGRDATIFDSTCISAQGNTVMMAGRPDVSANQSALSQKKDYQSAEDYFAGGYPGS